MNMWELNTTASVRPYNILDWSIFELDLPIRVTNCLTRMGIIYIRQLLGWPKEELMQIRSFGKQSFQDVQDALNQLFVEYYDELWEEFFNAYR